MSALPFDSNHVKALAYYTPRYSPNRYWRITNYRIITNALDELESGAYFGYVLWPDYSVYGRPEDIVEVFKYLDIFNVEVGLLHLMSNGKFGDPPGIYPISEELLLRNSLIPKNSGHIALIKNLSYPEYRKALDLQQNQIHRYQEFNEEFKMFPPFELTSTFPGGYGYQQSLEKFAQLAV